MPDAMIIQGKVEYIWTDEDFARMLRDKLGDDAERYFLGILFSREQAHKCPGECDKTYRLQEHYERVLKDVRDEVAAWKTRKMTKDEIDDKREQLIMTIDHEL